MATPLAGAEVERGGGVELQGNIENKWASLHFSYPIASSEKQMGRVLCGCFRGCPGHGT